MSKSGQKHLTSEQRDLLEFYKSGAQDYSKFKAARNRRVAAASPAASAALPAVNSSKNRPGSATQNDSSVDVVPPSSEAVSAGRAEAATARADAAGALSSSYIEFLKQQQTLYKSHARSKDVLSGLSEARRQAADALLCLRIDTTTTLQSAEGSTNWAVTSKYDVPHLAQDCGLKLTPSQLYEPSAEPKAEDIARLHAAVVAMRKGHEDSTSWGDVSVAVDAAVRRLDVVEREILKTNVDGTPLANAADGSLAALNAVFGTADVTSRVAHLDEELADLVAREEEEQRLRDQALENGEMALAEGHAAKRIDLAELQLICIAKKLSLSAAAKRDYETVAAVAVNSAASGGDSLGKIRSRMSALRTECEADIERVVALRRRVVDVEQQAAARVAADRLASDELLAKNAGEMETIFSEMERLEKQLEVVAAERAKEIRRRVEAKERDEGRVIEYKHFLNVCEKHCNVLDNTIKNCETMDSCAAISSDLVKSLETAIATATANGATAAADSLLTAHKAHFDSYRALYLTAMDEVGKRERKMEDLVQSAQAAQIQQEIAAETYDPAAKKFSEVKRQLLQEHQAVEDARERLLTRCAAATEQFENLSRQALIDAGVDFVHPSVEQQHVALERKARLVEYRAMASLGALDSKPLAAELAEIRRELDTTRAAITDRNTASSPANSRLPYITGK